METQELVEKRVFSEVVKFSITDSVIAEIKKQYLGLTVKGIDDKEGFDRCHEGRMKIAKLRIDTDKERIKYKADALSYNKRVETEFKRVTGPLVEVETHLKDQEDVVNNEKKRIADEAAELSKQILEERVYLLQKCNAEYSLEHIRSLTDEGFHDFLKPLKDAFNEEATKKQAAWEQEQIERKAEKDRLAKLEAEKVEQEKKTQAERAEQQKKLDEKDAENKKIRDELEERLRKESAEKDRIIKVEREKRDAQDRKREREEEAKRIEQQKKDDEAAMVKKVAEDQVAEEKAKEAEAKRIAEAKARQKVADEALFNSIKVKFHTIELAWVEIARLTKKERNNG